MQWFAYLIWGGLGLCVLLAAALILYQRFYPQQDVSSVEVETGAVETGIASFLVPPQRRKRLIDVFELHSLSLPQDDEDFCLWAEDMLGVQRTWLLGEDCPMFPLLTFHNRIAESFGFFRALRQSYKTVRLYVVRPEGIQLDEELFDACAVLCFAVAVEEQGQQLWRYYPMNVYWEWGYAPERIQCSQMIYIASRAKFDVVGLELEQGDLFDLLEGRRIPKGLLHAAAGSWDPLPLASAGEVVPGCDAFLLSPQELDERLKQEDWIKPV
ncbi:MAG: hypothetical protein JXR59_04440 [Desulfuromonadaceae bacterium]|nr:hypothetical protein [Desulfuromonadaceae bacterium]